MTLNTMYDPGFGGQGEGAIKDITGITVEI